MNIKPLLLLFFGLCLGVGALAQTPTPPAARSGAASRPSASADGGAPMIKIAVLESAALRSGINELKLRYDKLSAEFAPKTTELESMQTKLAAQEKLLSDPDPKRTPQQTKKLSDDYEKLKKEYQRATEDLQDLARKREEAETSAIYDKVTKFLDGYAQRHNITLVLELDALRKSNIVIYLAPGADITADFIKEYNNANPAPAATTKTPGPTPKAP